MRTVPRVVVVVLALFGFGFVGRCGGFREPDPEGCPEPDDVVVWTLALAAMDGPIGEGAALPIVYGPQGGTMVSFRLAFEATPEPDCFAQSTTLTVFPPTDGGPLPDGGSGQVIEETRSLRAFPAGATEAMWFIGDFRPGQRVRIHSEAYGLVAERTVVLE